MSNNNNIETRLDNIEQMLSIIIEKMNLGGDFAMCGECNLFKEIDWVCYGPRIDDYKENNNIKHLCEKCSQELYERYN